MKKLDFYESKNLNLSSTKANKELKWKTLMSQNDVMDFIVNWYKAYFSKKRMKIYSLNQIKLFISWEEKKRNENFIWKKCLWSRRSKFSY